MNIDDFKYDELKKIAALFSNAVQGAPEMQHDPMVGKYVLVRCYSAGVHAGVLVSQRGDVVDLKDSRRLWEWEAVGVALSGVAQNGLIGGKVDVINPEIRLTGAIELIPCSEQSRVSIHDFK